MQQVLQQKTGKTLSQWKQVLAKQGFSKHADMLNYLKSEYGIGHGFANFICLKYREADAASATEQELITQQYQGKDNLLPIFTELDSLIRQLGDDVAVAPKRAAVSYRVKRQFALVQPSTKKRIDLGLKLNDVAHQGKLETSGPFGAMCTHRVQLCDLAAIDEQLKEWLELAYQQAR